MNKFTLSIASLATVLSLMACAQTPDYKIAALTADRIADLEKDIEAKVNAEKAFASAISKETKNAAKWNVSIEGEIKLLRGVQEFADLALTQRLGVPRLPLQDFLGKHNAERREAAAVSAAQIATEETRLAVSFEKNSLSAPEVARGSGCRIETRSQKIER